VSVELHKPALSLAAEALAALEEHDFRGNVRELRNVVRRAALESNQVVLEAEQIKRLLKDDERVATAQSESGSSATLREISGRAARKAERAAIAEALLRTRGNKSQAAKALGVDYKTLHLKMKSLGIRSRDFAPPSY